MARAIHALLRINRICQMTERFAEKDSKKLWRVLVLTSARTFQTRVPTHTRGTPSQNSVVHPHTLRLRARA